jgi:translation initiation factor IF-2
MDKGVPFVLILNKADLEAEWRIADADLDEAKKRGWTILKTSAKTGAGVEEAFVSLARRMMG